MIVDLETWFRQSTWCQICGKPACIRRIRELPKLQFKFLCYRIECYMKASDCER